MKKALIILIIVSVILTLFSSFSTLLLIGAANTQTELENELEALQSDPQKAYLELKATYDELKEQYDQLLSSNDSATSKEPNNSESQSLPAGKFKADEVLSMLNITEYSYSSDFWHYAFLVIENPSDFNIHVSVDVKFYNDANELIGAKSAEQEAFEKGSKIVLYFMPDEKFTNMEYELTVSEEDYYDCVISDLSYETVSAKDKEIVSVTNNGGEAAEFVEGSALFFKDNQVVGFDQTYFVDDDSELKPGKTVTKEIDCYDDYDSVQFFFTGRR